MYESKVQGGARTESVDAIVIPSFFQVVKTKAALMDLDALSMENKNKRKKNRKREKSRNKRT